MIRDFRRSFEYYFQYPPELPRQMAAWWSAQGFEAKLAIGALLAVCAIYTLVYIRPMVGSFLAIFLPVRVDQHRPRCARSSSAARARSSSSPGKPRASPRNARWRYLFDVLYYFGPVLVVALHAGAAVHHLRGLPRLPGYPEFLRPAARPLIDEVDAALHLLVDVARRGSA